MTESISAKSTVRPEAVCVRHRESSVELHDYESLSGGLFFSGLLSLSFLLPVVMMGSHTSGEGLRGNSQLFVGLWITAGIGSLLGFGRVLLYVFSPVPILTITPGNPAPGECVTLSWRFHGRTRWLRTLAIAVRGSEQATVTGCESDTQFTSTFEKFQVLSTVNKDEIARGTVHFVLPEMALPSFKGLNNAIVWSFELEAWSQWLPNVHSRFEFNVAPIPSFGEEGNAEARFEIAPKYTQWLCG